MSKYTPFQLVSGGLAYNGDTTGVMLILPPELGIVNTVEILKALNTAYSIGREHGEQVSSPALSNTPCLSGIHHV